MTTIAQELVDALARLVPPSVMVPELVRLMGDENAELRAIGRCVASDPVLASDALRVANSAAYAAATGPISDCVLAVIRLGEQLLCSLVAARLRATLQQPRANDARGDMVWSHSLKVAIGARLIARQSRFTAPSLAFTAGLLVDVGQLVLADLIAHRPSAIALQPDPSMPLDEVERRTYGIDHAMLGAMTARHWSIPEPIPAAIAASHDPMGARGEARLPACVIHVADAIVSASERAAGHDRPSYRVCGSAFAALKLDDAAVERLDHAIALEFRTTQAALGLAEAA